MLRVAFYGDDVDRFQFVGMNRDWKSKVGWKVPADLVPGVTGMIIAHDVLVFLYEEHPRVS
jgi:hypothetical protein